VSRAGYDLRGAVMQHVAALVRDAMGKHGAANVVVAAQRSDAWEAIERGADMSMPTPEQVEQHLAICEAVEAIAVPEGLSVAVSQLEWVKMETLGQKVSGVTVALDAPGMREILVVGEVSG